jgi:hypothetical protein
LPFTICSSFYSLARLQHLRPASEDAAGPVLAARLSRWQYDRNSIELHAQGSASIFFFEFGGGALDAAVTGRVAA